MEKERTFIHLPKWRLFLREFFISAPVRNIIPHGNEKCVSYSVGKLLIFHEILLQGLTKFDLYDKIILLQSDTHTPVDLTCVYHFPTNA